MMKKLQNGCISIAILLFLLSNVGYAAEPNQALADKPATHVIDTQPILLDDDQVPEVSTADPYEWFNRPAFTFNEQIDKFFLKPVARVYNAIMPTPLNQGIHNVFLNINTIPTIANDLLQLNFYQSANDIWRLIVNTTIGVGGLFDIGSRIGLKHYTNDFGLTMAAWGYKNSNYLVVPFFGPSTPRDGIGWPVDYFAFSIYPHVHPQSRRWELYALSVVDRRAQLLKYQQVLEEAAVDKYVFVRNAYLQRRAYQIQENGHLGCYERQSFEPVQISTAQENSAGAENLTTTASQENQEIKSKTNSQTNE